MNTHPLPSVLKYLQVIVLTGVILYFGKTLFIPLFMGLLIAIVMFPVCKRLETSGLSKALAITSCLLIVTAFVSLLFLLLIWQVNLFSKDANALLVRLHTTAIQLQDWAHRSLGINLDLGGDWGEKISGHIGGVLQATFNTTVNMLFLVFLTPVYTALFLFHRRLFVQYLQQITPAESQGQLHIILKELIDTYFNYIKGMLLVYLIVGILNSIGLLALGVRHAILFGMLCAVMTIIPYLGIIVSALLPITVVWLDTGNIWYPIGVIGVFTFVQYLEANVIFPKVVGTQLHISTLAVLVAVIAGGIIWGVAGMILFIPIVAIVKIISENVEQWRPLNMLLDRT
jgi:predicted PurR-regulated permease PerM